MRFQHIFLFFFLFSLLVSVSSRTVSVSVSVDEKPNSLRTRKFESLRGKLNEASDFQELDQSSETDLDDAQPDSKPVPRLKLNLPRKYLLDDSPPSLATRINEQIEKERKGKRSFELKSSNPLKELQEFKVGGFTPSLQLTRPDSSLDEKISADGFTNVSPRGISILDVNKKHDQYYGVKFVKKF